jgi:hypothetical protein
MDASGGCSLRAASEEANALPNWIVIVKMPKGTFPLTLGPIVFSTGNQVIIDGAPEHHLTCKGTGGRGTIITGNNTFGIFSVAAGATLTVNLLGITGGHASNGGGIDNAGTLHVTKSVIFNNTADVNGGGINNASGVADATSSFICKNKGIGANTSFGAGIYNSGTLQVTTSTLKQNASSGWGGGIHNEPGSFVSLANSTVTSNTTVNGGGGLHNDGTMTVSYSTVNGNTAGLGGGIKNFGPQSLVTIVNSTITGNTGNPGAGILSFTGGTVNISSSTVAGNFGKGISTPNSPLNAVATIVANNTGGNCNGTVTDLGYNLDTGTTCLFSAAGSISNGNPNLGPLAPNGGPTWTMALLPPPNDAIDHIPTSTGDCSATDQRGYPRPDGGETVCDIGAFESAY